MGKTLGSILAVAAAVAVNVIPGAQGWASGVILSATGTGFAAVATVGAVVGIASAAVTAYGLSRISGLLGLGPNAPKPQTTEMAMSAAGEICSGAITREPWGTQHSRPLDGRRSLPSTRTMFAKPRQGDDPHFTKPEQRLAIIRLRGDCMGSHAAHRWALIERDANIHQGDLFMFGVDDFDHWTDLGQPDPVGGVAKRFIGIDERRGVMIFECDNPSLRMETGLNRLTFAHRISAVAPSRWRALWTLWRMDVRSS